MSKYVNARRIVAAAFAQEANAAYARKLIAAALDLDVSYTLRNVTNERGEVEMFVLEATLTEAGKVGRVETLMTGANGIIIPAEVIERASLAG